MLNLGLLTRVARHRKEARGRQKPRAIARRETFCRTGLSLVTHPSLQTGALGCLSRIWVQPQRRDGSIQFCAGWSNASGKAAHSCQIVIAGRKFHIRPIIFGAVANVYVDLGK